MQTKCLILNTCTKAINNLQDAKLLQEFFHAEITNHARDFCDAYNIASENVYVNYIKIDHQFHNLMDFSEVILLVPLEQFIPSLHNFIEDCLLTNRRGATDITVKITVNFNTVFISTGSVIITQEVFL